MTIVEETRMTNITPDQARRFQELLRTHRGNRTQAEVAKEAGVSQALISNLERGPHTGMRVYDLFKLLKYYRIEPNEIGEVLGFFTPPQNGRKAGLDSILSRLAPLSDDQLETVDQFLDLLIRGLRS